jgi:hypothetical protein
MADNIITPYFRAAFISIFKATSAKNQDGSVNKPKFSIRAAFPPTADLTPLKNQAQLAAVEKWGVEKVNNEKFKSKLHSPFRTNDELDNPIPGLGDDWVIMTFSANEDRKPGIVDASNQPIINDQDVYSGAWFRAQVRAYAYEQQGNCGVAFGLQNVQKIKDDEPLGAGKVAPEKAFSPVEGAGQAKSASDLF